MCPISTPPRHCHCGLVENAARLKMELPCTLLGEPLCLLLLPTLQGGRVENINMLCLAWCLKNFPPLELFSIRNVLNSPDTVLPMVLSCQGRSYSPPAPPSAGPHDLVIVHKSVKENKRETLSGFWASEHCHGLFGSLCHQG